MEVLKEILPINPYPFLVMAIGSVVFSITMLICSYTYKESYETYLRAMGYGIIFTCVFSLIFIIIADSQYTYQVLITNDSIFKELATHGYTVKEIYPGLEQKLYEIAGPILDWLQ